MVGWADVLIENFTPRVMDNFGLTWEVLHAINPQLIMVRMPAFGLDGPWRDWTGLRPNDGAGHGAGVGDRPRR